MTPSAEPDQPLILPERLDLSTVHVAAAELRAHEGAALTLDAGGVTHLGGLGVQLLLSAAKTWRAAGQDLHFARRSDSFDAALATFGVPLAALESGESRCP